MGDSERCGIFGDELASRTGLVPATATKFAEVLKGTLYEDFHAWFRDRIWVWIPADEWPESKSTAAYILCMNIVGFYQSLRSADIAVDLGILSSTQKPWLIHWLLRLNLGEQAASNAIENWLPSLLEMSTADQSGFICHMLAKSLPPIPAGDFLFKIHSPTLELRISAAVLRAYGRPAEAEAWLLRAKLAEQNLALALERHRTGGGCFFVLRSHAGIMTFPTPQGRALALWTSKDSAELINRIELKSTNCVSPLDYRELVCQLPHFISKGFAVVSIDPRPDGIGNLVEIHRLLEHINQMIVEVESTDLGRILTEALGQNT